VEESEELLHGGDRRATSSDRTPQADRGD